MKLKCSFRDEKKTRLRGVCVKAKMKFIIETSRVILRQKMMTFVISFRLFTCLIRDVMFSPWGPCFSSLVKFNMGPNFVYSVNNSDTGVPTHKQTHTHKKNNFYCLYSEQIIFSIPCSKNISLCHSVWWCKCHRNDMLHLKPFSSWQLLSVGSHPT